MKIQKINPEEILYLKKEAIKDGILFPKKNPIYYGIKINDKVVAFGGIVLKKTRAIIKCDYVSNLYRNKGMASSILSTRLLILKELGVKYIEANCTKMALNIHLRKGARISKEYKNGITKVFYENI